MTAISRRDLLLSSAAVLTLGDLATAKAQPTQPIVAGAIRWDAWYRTTGYSAMAQANLGPNEFHSRAPAHCNVQNDSAIECVGSQTVMDREIHAAAASGLKFWAFVWYGEGSDLRAAWNLYQSSSHRDDINWCGILTLATLFPGPFSGGAWKKNADEWSRYMQQSNYQKASVDKSENRPLLFILWSDAEFQSKYDGKWADVGGAFKYLADATIALGLEAPYVVVLHGVPSSEIVKNCHADALSGYIPAFKSGAASPYKELDLQTRAYWEALEKTGVSTVPIAIVGWDDRPRLDPKSNYHIVHTNLRQYYELSTPAEFAEHLGAAVDFVKTHPQSCPSKVVLIYSWDECDEGGGILPTLGDAGGSYLSAIAPLLQAAPWKAP